MPQFSRRFPEPGKGPDARCVEALGVKKHQAWRLLTKCANVVEIGPSQRGKIRTRWQCPQ